MCWQKLCFPGNEKAIQIWGLLWHLSGWGGGRNPNFQSSPASSFPFERNEACLVKGRVRVRAGSMPRAI